MRDKLIRFWAGLAIGALVSFITFQVNSQGVEDMIRRLSDAFFCGGMMCLCLGGLMFARNKGTFDILSYGLGTAFRLHVPGADLHSSKDRDYIAYRERKAASRRSAGPVLLSGLVYMAACVGCFILWEMV